MTPDADGEGLEALAFAHARADLNARWFLRALARGALPTEDHARTVEGLDAPRDTSADVLTFDQ